MGHITNQILKGKLSVCIDGQDEEGKSSECSEL